MASAELLDLDAAVFADYWSAVLDDVGAAAGPDVRRIVDLGSGTGTGALGLARRFPQADVVAVDSSAEMLAALRAKNGRIIPLLADLDAGWPAVDEVDVTFASMSLHHMADSHRVLAQVFAATRPGGIVAAAEFREPIRVLRDDIGRDETGVGMEARTVSAMHARHPDLSFDADWGSLLRAAGFEDVSERDFDLDLRPPVSADGHAYARQWLQRIRDGVAEHQHPAAADEFAGVLDALTPDDLHLHGRRTLTIARKP